jgi:hypothetical protein
MKNSRRCFDGHQIQQVKELALAKRSRIVMVEINVPISQHLLYTHGLLDGEAVLHIIS